MTSTRCLLARSTGKLISYPRQDDEPVIGLDRDAYQVLQVVRLEQPTPEPGYRVQAVPPVVVIDDPDADDLNGTVTYGWQVLPIDPPPPAADWAGFAVGLIFDPLIQQWFNGLPQAVTNGLSAGLQRASEGSPDLFLRLWGHLAAGIPAEVLAAVVSLAEACNLPADFLEAMNPPAGMVRARDEAGRFISDDPATPENEAWAQPE